ncbi:flagellar hook-basal body complex protein FliE [Dactylosporangium sp. NPDC051485]|uniref:flagellar hook-basal body complex protein FliE n=1 Tax=Dactylosporangium sp. NPDC051485 TaxID=3154846 RepID=UPI00343F9AD8
MSIDAIAPIASVAPMSAALGSPDRGVQAGSGANFGSMLAQGLQKLQDAQNTADDLAVQAATGKLTDVHDYIIAATEANLATSLTVAVRNRALDAFNEIMRMQA